MEGVMDRTRERENRIAGSAHAVVGKTLDTLESELDTATESTIHQLRNQTQEMADQALNRLTLYVEQRISKIEAYMASHPWVVLGSLLILSYVFSDAKYSRLDSGATGEGYTPRLRKAA
jgi:hypothetical protein